MEAKDRLYQLLPTIHRLRDAGQGEPLRQLLQVIAEQVGVVEEDIAQLYENWFIETAQDWVVPYIGDLLGYTPVHEAGQPNSATPALDKILFPRREVANTLGARRRKGTLALLEELGRNVAGWPTRAVEFYRYLVQSQNLAHLRPLRGRSVDLQGGDALDLLGSPFDPLAHSVDLRRINSTLAQGRYNLPSVGLFVWRLCSYPLTKSPATCIEEVGPNCFSFSVLGNDAPLFARPQAEPGPSSIAGEANLPLAIRRRALEKTPESYAGEGRSLVIYRGQKKGGKIEIGSPVAASDLIAADLSGWQYQPRRGKVAVDPLLGRMVFHPRETPLAVWVSYYYGFSADIGGGEYFRPITTWPDDQTFYQPVSKWGQVSSLEQALEVWEPHRQNQPKAIIEIGDSEVYSEQLSLTLHAGEHLEIRAANRTRPVIYLLDRERNQPDSLTVIGEAGEQGESQAPCLGRLTLDGLLITGRAVHLEGALQSVHIRHCTLVPGWGLEHDCEPERPAEPSLEIYQTKARVRIEKSILGSIQVYQDEVGADPTPIYISDSVLDATSLEREAVGAPNWPRAHATLHIARSTVLGQIQTHAIELAENSILMGKVMVARRQLGCMRFCYVPEGSRTPARYHCQPDLVEAPIRSQPGWSTFSEAKKAELLEPERLRVRPQFDSTRYGKPTYARLSLKCATEIARGALDESEMGVYHDLFQPQRLINLRTRLEEYTPAGSNVGVIFAD